MAEETAKYKTYSAEFKTAKLEEFIKSGKSESAFARENGISLSTFRSWKQKAGIGASSPSDGGEGLTLLEVTDRIQSAMNVVGLQGREVCFSVNGFRIGIEERDLKAFIRGMKDD